MKIYKSSSQLHIVWILSFLFVLTMYPFVLMLISSFKHQIQIINQPWFFTFPLYFSNYSKALISIAIPIINSTIVTGIGVVVVLVVASMGAYSFARFKFPGKNILYYLIIMLLMIPGFVLLIPQFIQVIDLGLYNSYLGQALPPAANNAAVGILLMRTFFTGLPKGLFEAAELEGAKEFQIYVRIVLPLSKPVIGTVAILTGIRIWNNFIWPLVITSGQKVRPVILAITLLQGSVNEGDGLRLAGYVIAAIPLVVFFFFMTKPFISGLTAGAVKG